jgi:hypothetical protein
MGFGDKLFLFDNLDIHPFAGAETGKYCQAEQKYETDKKYPDRKRRCMYHPDEDKGPDRKEPVHPNRKRHDKACVAGTPEGSRKDELSNVGEGIEGGGAR